MNLPTTRRSLLKGTAAASAAAFVAPTISGAALAALPPAGKQAPGYYRIKVGDYEVTLLHDGAYTPPLARIRHEHQPGASGRDRGGKLYARRKGERSIQSDLDQHRI
jgi:hypothetical protein